MHDKCTVLHVTGSETKTSRCESEVSTKKRGITPERDSWSVSIGSKTPKRESMKGHKWVSEQRVYSLSVTLQREKTRFKVCFVYSSACVFLWVAPGIQVQKELRVQETDDVLSHLWLKVYRWHGHLSQTKGDKKTLYFATSFRNFLYLLLLWNQWANWWISKRKKKQE